MTEAQNNVRLLHRKEWQTMTPTDTVTAAAGFTVNDNANEGRFAMYVASEDELVMILAGWLA